VTPKELSGIVRPMTRNDVVEVVPLHRIEFPMGFHARLGSKFMTLWFFAHLRREASISIVSVDENNKVMGYLIGSLDNQKYAKVRIENFLILFIPALFSFLLRPRIWIEFFKIRAFTYLKMAVRALLFMNPKAGQRFVGEIKYVNVKQELRLYGIATLLVNEIVRSAKNHGTKELFLVTEASNKPAVNFYTVRRWEKNDAESLSLDGRPLIRMYKNLV